MEYGATSYNVYGFNKFSLLEWAQANEYAITDLFGNSLQQPATYECCVDSFYWGCKILADLSAFRVDES